MERFVPLECSRKKGNTLRCIPFFSILPEFPEISVPFVYTYQLQAPEPSGSAYLLNGIFGSFFWTNGTALFPTKETERIEPYHSMESCRCHLAESAVPFVQKKLPKIPFKW